MKKSSAAFALFMAAATLSPMALAAQTGQNWEAGQLYASRAELEAMLDRYDGATTTSSIYSDAVRMPARDEADLIRARLTEGDFQIGDVITLSVAGQPTLTNNFTVAAGRLLILPDLPAMPLTGLLRSELQDSVRSFLSHYYRDPQVFVQTSMRIQAVGEVGQVGYQTVSAEARLPDVIASIGNPTKSADLDEMKIKRRDETIWEGEPLQEAIVEGRTMDQLSLRAGDVIEIPAQSSRNIGSLIRSLYYLVPLSFAIMRLF